MSDHPPHHDSTSHDDGSALEAAHTADHDDSAGHGHGADPNAGVVRGTPPTPAWVLTAALIGLVSVVATIVLAVALNDAIPLKAPTEHVVTEPGEDGEHAGEEAAPSEAPAH